MTNETPPAVLAPNARLEKIIAEMRAEARDASADGEDMSVMRGWANDLAKLARSLAQQQAAPAGEVWNDVLGELNEAYMRGQLGEDSKTIAAMKRIRFLLAQPQAAPAGVAVAWMHVSDLAYLKDNPHEVQAAMGRSHGPLHVPLFTHPAAPAAVDRAPETSRRMKAVELLLGLGFNWSGTDWFTPPAPAALTKEPSNDR